jgi:hypothetical protein
MVYSTVYTGFADTSSAVPEDGFDDFEFAKYLEDIVHLKRSKSMPASRISGIVEKACNECFFARTRSTTAASDELTDTDDTDDGSTVDYTETECSLLYEVRSDCDEIRKILTGGDADGWYSMSSGGPSPALSLGAVPLSTQSVRIVNSTPAVMRVTSMCQMSLPGFGSNVTLVPVSGTFEVPHRTGTSEAGNRPPAPAVERTPLRLAEALGDFLGQKKQDNALEEATAKTSIMLCNIPYHYTRSMVMDFLRDAGFEDHVTFIYIPMNLRSRGNFGYGFVDFTSAAVAARCKERLEGFNEWSDSSEKVLETGWCDTQGLDAHIQRYRNSPLMHESVDDELKPALFNSGVRVAFPKPTKNIRAPRLRKLSSSE